MEKKQLFTVAFGITPSWRTFEKFQVVKMLNDVMDKVRRQERKRNMGLKRSKMMWLCTPIVLIRDRRSGFYIILRYFPTAPAHELKVTFLAVYNKEPGETEQYLAVWVAWTAECGLAPFEEVSRTVDKHWDGFVNWFRSRLANGIHEAINSLAQIAKARGYRNDRTLNTMAYLIAEWPVTHLKQRGPNFSFFKPLLKN